MDRVGFGLCSGKPHPEQESFAAVAMLDFTLNHLGVARNDTFVASYSMGTFSSSVAGKEESFSSERLGAPAFYLVKNNWRSCRKMYL